MDVSLAVYPCVRTTVSAAGSPSAVAPFSVNAGAVAVRVVVGAGVPPPEVVPVVVVPVGAVVVLVVGCAVVCAGSGELATDTVLVAPPQPPSRAVRAAVRATVEARTEIGRVIGPAWY